MELPPPEPVTDVTRAGEGAPVDAAADGSAADAPSEPWTRPQIGSLAAYLVLFAAANVGSVLAPRLQTKNPALLLAMSARNRHLLVAVTNHISPAAYGAVAFVRLLVAGVVCYAVGHAFGGRAVHWLRRYLGVPQASIDQMERGFETASWALVPFFAGSNIVAMLAGVRPLPFRRFVALLCLGIAGRLVLFWFLAERLRKPLEAFVRVTTRFQVPLIAALLAWVVLSNVRNFRRGRSA